MMRRGLATAVGVVAALWCYWVIPAVGSVPVANDFTWHWLAGRALVAGQNPYDVILPGGPYLLNAPYLYPITSAIVAVPFSAWLPPVASASVFVGVSTALLVWGLKAGPWYVFPMILGIPFLWAAGAGQISILAMAGALIPGLRWLSVLKPNIGIALAAWRPARSLFIGTIALALLGLFLQPEWPADYLRTIRSRSPGNYAAPLTIGAGPLILAVLIKWRRSESWLILLMAIVPQTLLFYDQLPLWLVAKNRIESIVLMITSWIGFLVFLKILPAGTSVAEKSVIAGPIVVASLYLPATLMILLRPNDGKLPEWVTGPSLAVRNRLFLARSEPDA